MYIEGTDIHSDITVPRFYNISLFDIFQSDQCKGNHICYTETFDAFHVLGRDVQLPFITKVYKLSSVTSLHYANCSVVSS